MKTYKTFCCDFVYLSEYDSPFMRDGFCKECGYHPEIAFLNHELTLLKEELRRFKDFCCSDCSELINKEEEI